MTEQMKVHPVAAMFPLLQGAEFEQLKVSIQAEGLLQPIEVQTDPLTDERVLIDGRNRLRACQELGVEPRFEEYEGDAPVQHIISRNIARRHLDASQLAAVAARCRGPFEEEARARQEAAGARGIEGGRGNKKTLSANLREGIPTATPGKVSEKLAEAFGVSPRSIDAAIAIDKERPELLDKVLAGEAKVSTTYNAMRGKSIASQSERRIEQPEEELIGLIMMLKPAEIQDVIAYVKKLLGRSHDN